MLELTKFWLTKSRSQFHWFSESLTIGYWILRHDRLRTKLKTFWRRHFFYHSGFNLSNHDNTSLSSLSYFLTFLCHVFFSESFLFKHIGDQLGYDASHLCFCLWLFPLFLHFSLTYKCEERTRIKRYIPFYFSLVLK